VRASEVVETDVVRFGALVTLADEDGNEKRYRIVGPDEADPTAGRISFQSPLGNSLMKRKVGDTVSVRRPAGEIEIEILRIEYE
jgi:transcription elongation factor GreB